VSNALERLVQKWKFLGRGPSAKSGHLERAREGDSPRENLLEIKKPFLTQQQRKKEREGDTKLKRWYRKEASLQFSFGLAVKAKSRA